MTLVKPPGLQQLVNLMQTKLSFACKIFTLSIHSQEKCNSWAFHVDDRYESSSTWDMII
jgi:hypothetical protein